MKSEELSDILHKLLEVVRLYPGKDLGFILNDWQRLKENENKEDDTHKRPKEVINKATDEEQKARIDQLHERIDSLSMSEIDKKLNSEELFPSMAYLRYFAKKVGLDLAARQSKVNSIHTIKSHLDRMRIDRTISKRND